jgi:hypothetical protein
MYALAERDSLESATISTSEQEDRLLVPRFLVLFPNRR